MLIPEVQNLRGKEHLKFLFFTLILNFLCSGKIAYAFIYTFLLEEIHYPTLKYTIYLYGK